jgi:hypothetical protein
MVHDGCDFPIGWSDEWVTGGERYSPAQPVVSWNIHELVEGLDYQDINERIDPKCAGVLLQKNQHVFDPCHREGLNLRLLPLSFVL